MEPEIRRVNFFDGQFLKQGEFQAEQLYHRHMRQRLNYILFNGSGVVPLTPRDLNFIDRDDATKTFRIGAGMAISRKDDTREGLELILRQDSAIFDLNAEGLGAGQRAWVTVHYEEQQVADPPSEGDVDAPTRVNETAVLTVHSADPTGSNPANGEEYIILGSIAFDDMSPDDSQRQESRIAPALLGASGPAPTITGISPSTASQGSVITATITGTNLAGASAVTFSGSGITAAVQAGGTATTLPVQITTAAAAATTARTFTVTTPEGTADSAGAGVTFTVQTGLGTPTITGFSPNRARGTETLSVTGDQFAAPMQVTFAPATSGDPRVSADATVLDLNSATVVVPGPLIPTGSDPAVVASGFIRVVTSAGESGDSPDPFILETT